MRFIIERKSEDEPAQVLAELPACYGLNRASKVFEAWRRASEASVVELSFDNGLMVERIR